MQSKKNKLIELGGIRVHKINKLMKEMNKTSSDIYENLMDSDKKLAVHYLNKMSNICEEAKTNLPNLLDNEF